MSHVPASAPLPAAIEIGIVSTEPARIAGFYEGALGFVPTTSFTAAAGTVYKMRNGNARIKIFTPVATPAAHAPEPLGKREGIGYFALYVGDLDAAFARAVAAGAEVLSAPASHRPGAKAALVRDPGGNIVELLHDPAALQDQVGAP